MRDGGWAMAETETVNGVKESKLWKGVFAVSGIMSTLVVYGVLQVCLLCYDAYRFRSLVKGYNFLDGFCKFVRRR